MMQYRRFGRIANAAVFLRRYALSVQVARCPTVLIQDNQENLEATIRRAIEVGINHIETARGYGTSEMQLGGMTFPRDQLIVQTNPSQNPREFHHKFEQSPLTWG